MERVEDESVSDIYPAGTNVENGNCELQPWDIYIEFEFTKASIDTNSQTGVCANSRLAGDI